MYQYNLNANVRAVLAGTLLCFAGSATAGLIDFETVPGGAPSDGLAISTQYLASEGVTFSLLNFDSSMTTPFLEQTGGADSDPGFIYTNGGNQLEDTEAAGFEGQLGDFFLRLGQGALAAVPVPQLVISYSAPVSGASAEIWDIDAHNLNTTGGTEQWLVEAFDDMGNVVDSAESPEGVKHNQAGALDAAPWTWSLESDAGDIHEIKFTFTGTKTQGIGLAMDNFNTDSAAVPEPGTMALVGLGLLGMGFATRRRQRR